MAELTQNRPDVVRAGHDDDRRLLRVDPRLPAGRAGGGGRALGGVRGDRRRHASPVPEPVGDAWRVTIEPAIGEHGENRLVGCLEDVTIDRVVGQVLSLSITG